MAMKIYKKIMLAVILAALLAIPAIAFAHPPKAVKMSWDPSGVLTVNAEHSVGDPQKHYINKIIIYVNDKIVTQKEYKAQSGADGLTDTFNLGPQASGTTIKAEAFCIIMGSDTGSLTVP